MGALGLFGFLGLLLFILFIFRVEFGFALGAVVVRFEVLDPAGAYHFLVYGGFGEDLFQ